MFDQLLAYELQIWKNSPTLADNPNAMPAQDSLPINARSLLVLDKAGQTESADVVIAKFPDLQG